MVSDRLGDWRSMLLEALERHWGELSLGDARLLTVELLDTIASAPQRTRGRGAAEMTADLVEH
jgi:hypothetical protein